MRFSFNFMQLLLLLSVLHLTLARQQPVCNDNERSALLQFKQDLFDESASRYPSANPKLASWKLDEENSDCCSWEGVKCDEATGHVIKLDLASSSLYGSINSSSSLFQLVHLQWLSLAQNYLISSTIPSGIIKLTRLSHLNLSFSSFSGQIPSEILELSNLVSLDVSYNSFLELNNPTLTNLVEKLINLNVLALSLVKISSSIPPALTNLSSLTFLSLTNCRMRGKIPPSLGNLTKLHHLDLAYNEFSGELPEFFGNIGALNKLVMGSCNLSGKVPASLGNLTQLTFLELSGNYFSGLNSDSLSWIANLKKLSHLDLSNTSLTGEIPSVLMNLTQLTLLYLSENQLTGPIPSWLMNLNKLSDLDLDSNHLSGHIPVEIRNLTQLEVLNFAMNQLEGSIPNSIFELKSLRGLLLSSNKLSSTLDLNMFLLNFQSLETLELSSNKLSLLTQTTPNTNLQKFGVIGFSSCNLTEFPYFLHNQDQLMFLDLSSNKIAGQVPGWLFNGSSFGFEYLNLSNNLLTGFEHNILENPWPGQSTLDFRFNKLQGQLPVPSVSTYSYLVSNNQLTGEIPLQICSLNGLYALDLSYNNFSGVLPECLGNFSRDLSVLKLQGNNFHGSIPHNFMNGTNLRVIDLRNNSFQGRLPQSLANCVKLKYLNLGNNLITDIFPSWLGYLSELEVLILKFNRFYGVIREPKTCFQFPKLRIIDLSHNRLTGNLPRKYFECWNAMKVINASKLTYLQDMLLPSDYTTSTYYGNSYNSLTLSNKGTEMEYERLSNLMTAIILSNNKFGGEIPTSIADLKGIRDLDLANNNLKGHIPSSLVNLRVLESLDFSNNKLSGEIPEQLGQLTALAFFDVSHNLLTGSIPRGTQFSTFNSRSFDGNIGLCGEPLSTKCENTEASQEEDPPHSESLFAFGWKIVLIGYGSGTIIGVVLGHIFSTRKQEWLAKTFRLRLKTIKRKRRRRN